jgi:transketolase C-terminal domain/subunit
VLGAVSHFTTRCLDSIHSQICRHRARVTLVGHDAPPRGAAESSVCRHDVALLRPLPNLAIACPADESEFTTVLRASLSRTSATYIRMAGTTGSRIHPDAIEIRPGRCVGRGARGGPTLGIGRSRRGGGQLPVDQAA